MTDELQPDFDEQLLHQYLDGELDPKRSAELEAALTAHPTLAQQLAELRTLFSQIEALPEAQLGTDLSTLVLASLHTGAGWPQQLRWAAVFQLGLAALVLLLSWPFLLLFSQTASPVAISDFISLTIAGLSASLTQFWSQVSIFLSDLIPQINQWVIPAPNLGLSTTLLLPLLITAALLWLFGNGLLLRQFTNGRQGGR